MADLLKNMYNDTFIDQMTYILNKSVKIQNENNFKAKFKSEEWEGLELKQRISYLAKEVNHILPSDFRKKVNTIYRWIEDLQHAGYGSQSFHYIFIPEIILSHGLDKIEISIEAMEKITSFTSFEFGVRSFIITYPEEMMAQLLLWSKHPNENVRRFSSEGCRPRLPWGLQLKSFVTDPSPIIPILENLKQDESEYVRKSVANNINDISKDHPELVIELIRKWKGNNPKTDWIVKHAARTLLKKGNPEVLALFDVSHNIESDVSNFKLSHSKIQIGDSLSFEFTIQNRSDDESKFRLEYFVYFMKSSGQMSKKIFKIAELSLQANQDTKYERKHKFIDLTTRKHYPGAHRISIVVNGVEKSSLDFILHPE